LARHLAQRVGQLQSLETLVLAGQSMTGTLTFILAFVVVLGLIGLFAWGVRRFAGNRLGANTNRGRMPRLAVIDAAAVDGRRRLVLVRRDNVEHLLMIGGPTDIVVEPNIVRANAGREQLPQRPAGADIAPLPRVAPLPEPAGWAEPEDTFAHAEPQMPEPPPRPTRPAFADEMRRSSPPPMPIPERRPDPLAGLTAEPPPGRPEPRVEARPEPPRLEPREPRPDPRAEWRAEPRPEPAPPRMPRSEPIAPRPPRPAPEAPKAPPLRAERPERAIAPPPPPPPPPAPAASADQNLAEMAQRLEAALRRPAGAAEAAPPVAPEPPPAPVPVRPSRAEPAPPAAAAPQKTGFENLEDEMASLLGRPKSSSS
jgi:flagellar protein FliO/FliZ